MSSKPTLSGADRDAAIESLAREHGPAEWRRRDDAYRAEHLEIAATADLPTEPGRHMNPDRVRAVFDAFFTAAPGSDRTRGRKR